MYKDPGSQILMTSLYSCETSLHYVPLQTLMVPFDQNNFRLNKTGLHMVDGCYLDVGCGGVSTL